jgi:hypothetical protein
MLGVIDDKSLDQGFLIGLAVVSSLCLVGGFVLFLWNRKTRAAATEAAKDAAQAARDAARNPALLEAGGGSLAQVDWDKFGELLDKFPENDRAPLAFSLLGALGWLVVALVQGWIEISFGTQPVTGS